MENKTTAAADDTAPAKGARLLLAAFACSGTAALIYEVTWTRALTLVIGSTTYSVSTMLATFMAGLAIGGAVGGKLADRRSDHATLFAYCELGIGLAGIVSVPLIYALPRLYIGIYRLLHLYPTLFFISQILLCALVMLVPTILMGATFPLVSTAITRRLEEVGGKVGKAYSLNTVGAVLGSLGAGFLLIPLLGLTWTTVIAGAINLSVGTVLLIQTRRFRTLPGAVLVLLYVGTAGLAAQSEPPANLYNFYSARQTLGAGPISRLTSREWSGLTPLYDRHFAEGHVRAYRTADDHLLLQVGGKLEGTAAADKTNALLISYMPAAAHPDPKRMLVIGLGAGVTLEAAKASVAEVDLVEIHPGVLDVVRRFGPPGVLDDVAIVQDDARSFLLKTEQRYDIIASEPSYPTESVVANLFTSDYFEMAARRLNPGGIYAQWMPQHLMSSSDITMMIKTFGAVFPHVYLFKIPDARDLMMLGSRAPFVRSINEMHQRLMELNRDGWPLSYAVSRTPQQVVELLAGSSGRVNTDDHPVLEFRAARNLVLGDRRLLDEGP